MLATPKAVLLLQLGVLDARQVARDRADPTIFARIGGVKMGVH